MRDLKVDCRTLSVELTRCIQILFSDNVVLIQTYTTEWFVLSVSFSEKMVHFLFTWTFEKFPVVPQFKVYNLRYCNIYPDLLCTNTFVNVSSIVSLRSFCVSSLTTLMRYCFKEMYTDRTYWYLIQTPSD